MKKILLSILLFTFYLQGSSQNNNGKIDTISEMYKKENISMPMHDTIHLNTDIYYPKLMDSYTTTLNVPIPGLGQSDSIVLMKKGSMLFKFANQPDSSKLPTVLLRTPYDSRDAGANVYLFPLLGYALAVQDERGRYLSEGTYIPFYNDGWKKTAYGLNRFFLDPTPDSSMSNNEDGVETIQYIIDSLQVDLNDDGIPNYYLSNGDIGMYGGSAEGYSQYQAAAGKRVDLTQNGLKCIMPVVATGEFQQSTSTPNGVFRQALVTGWLTNVMSVVDTTNSIDYSIFNNMHTPSDYGLNTVQELIDTTIYSFSEWKGLTYPSSPYRAMLDISQAVVNSNGESAQGGSFSRYTNMNVPIYHTSGWWDIFTEGQIETFVKTQGSTQGFAKNRQKLVVGPWTHQTITTNEVGDQNGVNGYPNSVYDVFGNFGNINNLFSSDNFIQFLNSELVTWFRGNLGEPTVVIPANDWQNWSSTSSYKVKIPATDYTMSYEQFINFLLGTQGLPNFPISLMDTITTSVNTMSVSLPASGSSMFGDTATLTYVASIPEWDETAQGGIPAVRAYIVGPTNDPSNANVGNYWMSSNFFPSGDEKQKWYFHANNTIDTLNAQQVDSLYYVSDPNNPVQTIGGGNMVIPTPDGLRKNNGQMDMTTWDTLTMNRADVLIFESGWLTDTLSVIGFPKVSLWASLSPINSAYPDSANGDFVVRIVDVYPNGREMYVTEGAVNVRAREYAKSKAEGNTNNNAPWSNLASGTPYNFYFQTLPLGYTFGVGHKVKVLISSSNYPRYQSSHNIPLATNDFIRFSPNQTVNYSFYGNNLSAQSNGVQFFTDGNYASFIELPVYKNGIVGLNENAGVTHRKAVKIYPNPNKGVFTIQSNTKIKNISIFDITGKNLFHKFNVNNFTEVIHVEHFPKGVYIVKVEDYNLETSTTKLLIQK